MTSPKSSPPSGPVSSALPSTTMEWSSRMTGVGTGGAVSANSSAVPGSSGSPQLCAMALSPPVGTKASWAHSASMRMSLEATAATAASSPMTTTRTGSLVTCGAGCGSPWCGTFGWAAISSSVGVGSVTSSGSGLSTFSSRRVGIAETS